MLLCHTHLKLIKVVNFLSVLSRCNYLIVALFEHYCQISESESETSNCHLYVQQLNGKGRSRTYVVSYVTDLQSAVFATGHTLPRNFVWLTFSKSFTQIDPLRM